MNTIQFLSVLASLKTWICGVNSIYDNFIHIKWLAFLISYPWTILSSVMRTLGAFLTQVFLSKGPHYGRQDCPRIGILVLKMLLMSAFTAFFRIKNRAFSSPEDLIFGGKKTKAPKYDDPSVERVRRAHRNDLENVIPFILASFFYTLTNPTPFLAMNLVRVGALSRIAHTVVYAFGPVPQPTRAIAFGVPFAITLYMSVQILLHFA